MNQNPEESVSLIEDVKEKDQQKEFKSIEVLQTFYFPYC